MTESAPSLAALRQSIAALDRGRPAVGAERFLTGHEMLDRALDGGLARGRVHELLCEGEEEGAGEGLALLLARLAAGDTGAPLLWLRMGGGGTPYGPGLAALGIDPARLLLGVMADEAMLLQAALDALRCAALGAVVVECRGRQRKLDLTASRRLVLAAEASGVTALLLLIGSDPVPSAAETRWRVAAAPSVPLPGDAPGHSAFDLTLLRRRAGRDGMRWRLIWRAQQACFGDYDGECERRQAEGEGGTALSGAVVPVSGARPASGRAA